LHTKSFADIVFYRYRRKVESQMNVADRLSSFKMFGRKDWDKASIGITVDPGCNGEAGGKGSDQELGN
jgi:hypothetical protein